MHILYVAVVGNAGTDEYNYPVTQTDDFKSLRFGISLDWKLYVLAFVAIDHMLRMLYIGITTKLDSWPVFGVGYVWFFYTLFFRHVCSVHNQLCCFWAALQYL